MNEKPGIKQKLTKSTIISALAVLVWLVSMIISIRYISIKGSAYIIEDIIITIMLIFWLLCNLNVIKSKKPQVFGLIAMSAVTVCMILELIAVIAQNRQYSEADNTILILPMIFPIAFLLLALLTIIVLLKKASVNMFVIFSIALEVVLGAFSMMANISNYNGYKLANLLECLMWVLFYFSFLTYYRSDNKENVKQQTVKNPQQELATLKEFFDSGAITEEEYNQKRAEILNSL